MKSKKTQEYGLLAAAAQEIHDKRLLLEEMGVESEDIFADIPRLQRLDMEISRSLHELDFTSHDIFKFSCQDGIEPVNAVDLIMAKEVMKCGKYRECEDCEAEAPRKGVQQYITSRRRGPRKRQKPIVTMDHLGEE